MKLIGSLISSSSLLYCFYRIKKLLQNCSFKSPSGTIFFDSVKIMYGCYPKKQEFNCAMISKLNIQPLSLGFKLCEFFYYII